MSETQMQRTEQPTVAFVLSLLAGLWMLAAGGMMGGYGWGGMMGGARHGWLDVGSGHAELWCMVALVWNLRRNDRPSQCGHALRQTRAKPKLGRSGLSRFGSKLLHGDGGPISRYPGCDQWDSGLRHERLKGTRIRVDRRPPGRPEYVLHSCLSLIYEIVLKWTDVPFRAV
jgi:hypothetical protein